MKCITDGDQNVQLFCFTSGLATLCKISRANEAIVIISKSDQIIALVDEALL